VKIAWLLEQLKPHSEIKTIETKHPDGTRTFVFSCDYPFPRSPEPAWYVIVVRPNQEDIDNREVEAMLRHLWMFQLELKPEPDHPPAIDLAASGEE